MADHLMDLADALVTALTAAAADFTSSFTASWKDDALAELADATLKTPQVWVVDFAEDLMSAYEANAYGSPLEEYELLVVVQQKIDPGETRATVCRAMSLLVSEITRYCRKTPIGSIVCRKTERKPARDLKAYNENGLFRAEIITYWRAVYDD